jgi:hypothetical protein
VEGGGIFPTFLKKYCKNLKNVDKNSWWNQHMKNVAIIFN